ncbi:MAG: hypothetical protein WCK49_03060 [Myxococcaceae bacterium]
MPVEFGSTVHIDESLSRQGSEALSTPLSSPRGSVGDGSESDNDSFAPNFSKSSTKLILPTDVDHPDTQSALYQKIESEIVKVTGLIDPLLASQKKAAEDSIGKFTDASKKYTGIAKDTGSSIKRWFARKSPDDLGLTKKDIDDWDTWKAKPENKKKSHRAWFTEKLKESDDANKKIDIEIKTKLDPLKNPYEELKEAVSSAQSAEKASQEILSKELSGTNSTERLSDLETRSAKLKQNLQKLRELKRRTGSLEELKARKRELEFMGLRSELAGKANALKANNDPRFAAVDAELSKLLSSFETKTQIGGVQIQTGREDEYKDILKNIVAEESKPETELKQDTTKYIDSVISQSELALAQLNFTKMAIELESQVENLEPGSPDFLSNQDELFNQLKDLNLRQQSEKRWEQRFPERTFSSEKALYDERSDNAAVLTLELGVEITDGEEIFKPVKNTVLRALETKSTENEEIIELRNSAARELISLIRPEIQMEEEAQKLIRNMQAEFNKASKDEIVELKEKYSNELKGLTSTINDRKDKNAVLEKEQYAKKIVKEFESKFSELEKKPNYDPEFYDILNKQIESDTWLDATSKSSLYKKAGLYRLASMDVQKIVDDQVLSDLDTRSSERLELVGKMCANVLGENTSASAFLKKLGLKSGRLGTWMSTNMAHGTYKLEDSSLELKFTPNEQQVSLLKGFSKQRLEILSTKHNVAAMKDECEADLQQLEKISKPKEQQQPEIEQFASSIINKKAETEVILSEINDAPDEQLEALGASLANNTSGAMTIETLLQNHLGLNGLLGGGNWQVKSPESSLEATSILGFNLNKKQAVLLKAFSEQRLRSLDAEKQRPAFLKCKDDLDRLETLLEGFEEEKSTQSSEPQLKVEAAGMDESLAPQAETPGPKGVIRTRTVTRKMRRLLTPEEQEARRANRAALEQSTTTAAKTEPEDLDKQLREQLLKSRPA